MQVLQRYDVTVTLCFEDDPDTGGYVASVLEIQGCSARGRTLEIARINLLDSLADCLLPEKRPTSSDQTLLPRKWEAILA